LESPSNDDDHPLKRYCLTSVYEEDMDWMKNVLKDIQASLNEIEERLKGDVDVKIEKGICRLQQMS
jgi:argininosuccinate synthase